MLTDLRETEFTFFDTETTGLDPVSDRVIEIAAVRMRGNEKTGEFHSLVDPGMPVPEGASRVNGITDAMLAGAPRMAEGVPKFSEFVRGSCLCAYNAPFDMGFVTNEWLRAGASFPDIPVLDVLAMARQLLALERHPLWYVAQSLGITRTQEHRALSDVELTVSVFLALSRMLDVRDVRTLGEYVCLFGRGCRLHEQMRQEKLDLIRDAIGAGGTLRMRYFSRSEGRVSERELIPRELRVERGSEYLVGFCLLRNDERIFRVGSILRLERKEESGS